MPGGGQWFCPVWALTRFLSSCHELGLDRGGELLPAVSLRPDSVLLRSSGDVERARWAKIAKHLGLDSHPEIQDGTFSCGLHGLRTVNVTRAAEEGWGADELRRLGGWASLSSALGYVRETAGPRELAVDASEVLAAATEAGA